MSCWNHRVIRHVHGDDVMLGIHEVDYDDDDNPESCSVKPDGVIGESIDDLRKTLQWMLKCLDEKVLEYTQFGKDTDHTPLSLRMAATTEESGEGS